MPTDLKLTPKLESDNQTDRKPTMEIKHLQSDGELAWEMAEAANEDMRFVHVPGGQWEGFIEEKFGKRTMMVFDKVGDVLNRLTGQWNLNRVAVEFKPDDDKTNDDDADLLNGIYRKDYRQYSGKMAIDQAVDEQFCCGYGAIALGTVYERPEDPRSKLQRIEFRPIHNAYNTTIWDGNARRIDKRDARRCTLLEPFTEEAFKEAYPGKNPVSAFTPPSDTYGNGSIRSEGLIYVAKQYTVVVKDVKHYLYNNLETGEVESYTETEHEQIKDELAGNENIIFEEERVLRIQSVEVSVFNGEEYLEKPKKIAGKHIPVIPFYGFRAYVDGVETYQGVVRRLKDPARAFNVQVSQVTENAASGSNGRKAIVDPDQMTPQCAIHWEDPFNKAYLPLKSLRDKDGTIVQSGPIGYLEPGQLDPNVAALIQLTSEYIREVSGGAPQDTMDPKASGKAINALTNRADMNTQPIMDNTVNSHEWLGTVYASIAADVYNSKRVMRVLGREGKETKRMLHEEVTDEQTGNIIQVNTISNKRFSAYASSGPQFDTLREQTVEHVKGMIELLSKIPGGDEYITVLMPLMLENISGVNVQPLKDFVRKKKIYLG